MAILASTVKLAIEDTIAGITPTVYPTIAWANFGDDSVPITEQAATRSRTYDVGFAGGELGEVHTVEENETIEDLEITLRYPSGQDIDRDDNQIRQDVGDIRKALNDPSHWASGVIHQIVLLWPRPVLDTREQTWKQLIKVRVRFMETFDPENASVYLGPSALDIVIGAAAGTGATVDSYRIFDGGGRVYFTAGTSPPGTGTLLTLTLSRSYLDLFIKFENLRNENGDDNSSDIDLAEQLEQVETSGDTVTFRFVNEGPALNPGDTYGLTYSINR